MPVGRILVNGEDRGSGFALATTLGESKRVVLTANHVVRDQAATSLQFAPQGGLKVPVERVERDEDLDVAVLHLSEDVPEGLTVAHAVARAAWQVETQPRDNDPKLTGTITDTSRRVVNAQGRETRVMQLQVDQSVGDFEGYSGSPVMLQGPPGPVSAPVTPVPLPVIGVLVEQLRWRVTVQGQRNPPVANVLYAIPIQDVLKRFGLTAVSAAPPVDPAAAQALLDTMPLDTIPSPAPLPPGSRMPLTPNPLFIGRDDELRALMRQCRAEGGTVVISTGIGGVGKTQLAIEFVHRYGQYFAGGVFWLSFADPAGIPTEIAACGGAGAMELYTDADGLKQDEQVARVLAALASPLIRLLIFDNCDDTRGRDDTVITGEQLLRHWKPVTGGCRILITSRRVTWSPTLGVATQELHMLDRRASVTLLQSLAPDLNETDATAIAAELGDLPLALYLAGSFLAKYGRMTSPAVYLERLRSPDLLTHPSLQGRGATDQPTGHELHVARTFAMSYDQLTPRSLTDVCAVALLARAARLAPGKSFPHTLLTATVSADDEETMLTVEDAIQRLVDLGLLERVNEATLRMHRLLAVFGAATAPSDGAQTAVEMAVLDVAHQANRSGYPNAMLPILPHLRFVTEAAQSRGDHLGERLCTHLGYYLHRVGDYAQAEGYFSRALALSEQLWGKEHVETATALNNLAAVLQARGDYAAARSLYERALNIREQSLGPDHPETAQLLNSLAEVVRAQGEHGAARLLIERALAINERQLEPTPFTTASVLNNLAGLSTAEGDDETARSLYERSLAISEQAHGTQHPEVAPILNNLGHVLRRQGDYAGARKLYERALNITEHVFGPMHPNTSIAMNSLAQLLEAEGDYGEAEALHKRVLTLREQAFGEHHPATATALHNLGSMLSDRGDYRQAGPLLERALAIREQILGPTHPDIATTLSYLADVRQAHGDAGAARALLERALAIREQILGPTHPDMVASLAKLAKLLAEQSDYQAARALLERALAIGPTHPDTAAILHDLARLHRAQGNYGAAGQLYQHALAIRKAVLGLSDAATATTLSDFGGMLVEQHEYQAAGSLLEQALTIFEQTQGPDHPNTASTLHNLAINRFYQGNVEEAVVLMRRALTIREAKFGPEHRVTQNSRQYLTVIEQQLANAPPTSANA